MIAWFALVAAAHAGPFGPRSTWRPLSPPPPPPGCTLDLVDGPRGPTYERFVTAALSAARGAELSADDRDLVVGVHAQFLKLHARPLQYADLAAHLLASGEARDPRVQRAIDAHGAAPRALTPRAVSSAEILTVYSTYIGVIRKMMPPIGRVDDAEKHFKREIDAAYRELYGAAPYHKLYADLPLPQKSLEAAIRLYLERKK